MRILITGGCGFLGSNLASEIILKKRGKLFIIDNFFRTGSKINLKWLKTLGKFKFYDLDIRAKDKLEKVIREIRPDAIFHLAGQVAMTTSIADPRLDFEINAIGTFNVLDSVRKYSPKSIVIYSSTNKVYGDLEWVEYKELAKRYVVPSFLQGFPESIPLSFSSPYGCSKGAADQYMIDFSKTYGLKTVVFRHSSIYGGRQFSTYDQGWVGWFCQQAVETQKRTLKKPFTISGNGKQVRDLLYCDDAIKLYFGAIDHIKKIRGHVFNIGGGVQNSLSLLELFDILEQELDIKLVYKRIPWRTSDQKVFIADTTKYRNITHWSPRVDKREGVKRMLDWVMSLNCLSKRKA